MQPNMRRCVSCRKVADRTEFLRVVRVHPTHKVQLDDGMGRSAYICQSAACLKVAQKKNRLGRSLRANVSPDIYETLLNRVIE